MSKQYAAHLLRAHRGRLEKGIGKAKTVGEVALGSYAGARLSAHLGGPEGKKLGGVIPLEVAIGIGCAGIAMSGAAGRYAEDLMAVGLGSVSGYTARLGFTAGLKTAKPPQGVVSGSTYYDQIGAGHAGYFGAPNTDDELEQAEAVLDALAA